MSQKTDNMIKLALVFFVSLLSFSIGTYVGKKYSDNQYKLSQLEPQKEKTTATTHGEEFAREGAAINEAETAHAAAGTNTADEALSEQKPAALTDSEVAKIAEEFATDDNEPDTKTADATETEEVKTIPNTNTVAMKTIPPDAKKPVAVIHATPPVKPTFAKAKELEPAKVAAEERVPASIPPKKEVTAAAVPLHFTVQIGSYPTADEAEKMTKDLQSKGYKTTYVPAKINGQTWYRVSVGLFGSIREAQDYKKEFLEKTKLSSAIVQRVQQ
jgi:DedD protein